MASLQQQVWKWAKALDKSHLGAYDAAWEVVSAVSEADMRRKIGVADVQAIIEKKLAQWQKAQWFLSRVDEYFSNEEEKYEYVADRFRKPESKSSRSMSSWTDHSTDIPTGGNYVPPEPWYYFFPRELEGNYEGLLVWANDYYAQAIETLERMKKEAWA